MIHPERAIAISTMVALVAGGFTWFSWGLCQNLFAMGAYKRYLKRQQQEEIEKKRREDAERQVREQLNEQRQG